MRTKRMVTSLWVIAGLACATFSTALAADEIDILKYLYDKSDLIVAGKIIDEPGEILSRPGVRLSILRGACDFQVEDVLKGDGKLKGQNIRVGFRRVGLGDEEEKHKLYRKDAECILFLKYEAPGELLPWEIEELKRLGIEEREVPKMLIRWRSVDWWFGVQPRNSAMERTLKSLSKKK